MAAVPEQCIEDYKYLFSKDLLRGKVAFVTGGGSGIGFTIVEIFMRHGCDVVIASRNEDKLRAAARTLEAATGRTCMFIQMDVRKAQNVADAVDKALQRFGKIDILVNNAAGNFISPITGLSLNAYKTVLDIDTVGTFLVSKTVYEKCLQARGGVILNITATLHYRGQIAQAHAGSAKAAIDALTKHMAVEWGQNGVRVVGIAPGPIDDTEGMRRLGGGRDRAVLESMIPLKRLGKRVEIAHTGLFLVSDAGSLVTGETVVVDGGSWLGSPDIAHFQGQKATFGRPKSKM